MSLLPLPAGHPARLPIPPIFMPQNPLGAILGGLTPQPQYQPQVPAIFGGGPQPGSVPMPTGEPVPTSPQQAAGGRWAKLWQAMNSPQGQAYLMGAGLSIMNRPRDGESPLQHIVNGLTTGGLGSIYAMQAIQRQRAMEDKKMQLEERKVTADEQQVANQGAYQQGSLKNEQARIDVAKWSAEQEATYRTKSLEQQENELAFQREKLRQDVLIANRRAATDEKKVAGDLKNDAERNRLQAAAIGVQRMQALTEQKRAEAMYGKDSDEYKYTKLASDQAEAQLRAVKDSLFLMTKDKNGNDIDPQDVARDFFNKAYAEAYNKLRAQGKVSGPTNPPAAGTPTPAAGSGTQQQQKTFPRAQLTAFAQRNNMTPEQAEAGLKAQGYVVQ